MDASYHKAALEVSKRRVGSNKTRHHAHSPTGRQRIPQKSINIGFEISPHGLTLKLQELETNSPLYRFVLPRQRTSFNRVTAHAQVPTGIFCSHPHTYCILELSFHYFSLF
jgi:hypothetical protein